MKKLMFALMLTLTLCLAGQVLAQTEEQETVRFMWNHNPPADMSHYLIYEYYGPGGNPSGLVLNIPYKDGTVEPFMSDQQITLPCDIETERCYRISAVDKTNNESPPSDEACKLMASDCAPDTPSQFIIEFPVVPETTTTTP